MRYPARIQRCTPCVLGNHHGRDKQGRYCECPCADRSASLPKDTEGDQQ